MVSNDDISFSVSSCVSYSSKYRIRNRYFHMSESVETPPMVPIKTNKSVLLVQAIDEYYSSPLLLVALPERNKAEKTPGFYAFCWYNLMQEC